MSAWLLLRDGRILARGSRSTVLEAAEERRFVITETLGAHTADPAYVPRVVARGVRIVPEASAASGSRRAA